MHGEVHEVDNEEEEEEADMDVENAIHANVSDTGIYDIYQVNQASDVCNTETHLYQFNKKRHICRSN